MILQERDHREQNTYRTILSRDCFFFLFYLVFVFFFISTKILETPWRHALWGIKNCLSLCILVNTAPLLCLALRAKEQCHYKTLNVFFSLVLLYGLWLISRFPAEDNSSSLDEAIPAAFSDHISRSSLYPQETFFLKSANFFFFFFFYFLI